MDAAAQRNWNASRLDATTPAVIAELVRLGARAAQRRGSDAAGAALAVDGLAGPKTIAAIEWSIDHCARDAEARSTSTAAGGTDANRALARAWNAERVDRDAIPIGALVELVRLGAREVQAASGITVDGLAGPNTIRATLALIGSPKWSAAFPATGRRKFPTPSKIRSGRSGFGSFSWEPIGPNSGGIIVDRAWSRANIVRVDLADAGRVIGGLHRSIAELFAATYADAVRASKYQPRAVGWVTRRAMWSTNPSAALSLHSWGAAVDFDSRQNRYGAESGTPMHEAPEFVATFERAGFSWGGRWRTPDPMHFEATKR